MTAALIVLLKRITSVIHLSTQLNVTSVGTTEGCLLKSVMTGTRLMEWDVLLTVFQYYQLGHAQEEMAHKMIIASQSMATELLLAVSNVMITIPLTMMAAPLSGRFSKVITVLAKRVFVNPNVQMESWLLLKHMMTGI